MPVKTITLLGPAGDDATRVTPSDNIWFDCPWSELVFGTVSGVWFEDHFTSFPKTPPTTEGNFGRYAAFTSSGGTMTAGTGQGGELVIASDDDNEGASIRTVATPFLISRSTKKFWFEARLKVSSVTDTKYGMFIGLMQDVALTAILPITAAGAIADTNICGFHRLEGDGVHLDTIYKADGVSQVNVQTDAATIAADTYFKVGMRYDPSDDPTGTTYLLSFFKNNTLLTTTKQIPSAAGSDFPNDVGLGLVFAVLNAAGTSPGSATLDWWRAAQLI